MRRSFSHPTSPELAGELRTQKIKTPCHLSFVGPGPLRFASLFFPLLSAPDDVTQTHRAQCRVLRCLVDGGFCFDMFIGLFLLLRQQLPDATRLLIRLAALALSPLFVSGKLEDNCICETCLDLFSLPSPSKQCIINAAAGARLPELQYYSSDVGHLSG